MTNRVLLGNKNGAYGLWISRPGYDVFSASLTQMLLSIDGPSLQILQIGQFNMPSDGSSVTIATPNFGFSPAVYVTDAYFSPTITVTWVSATAFKMTPAQSFSGWSNPMLYIVLSRAIAP